MHAFSGARDDLGSLVEPLVYNERLGRKLCSVVEVGPQAVESHGVI